MGDEERYILCSSMTACRWPATGKSMEIQGTTVSCGCAFIFFSKRKYAYLQMENGGL